MPKIKNRINWEGKKVVEEECIKNKCKGKWENDQGNYSENFFRHLQTIQKEEILENNKKLYKKCLDDNSYF